MHVYGSKDAIWNGSKDWCRRTLITTLFMRAKTGNSLKVQHRDFPLVIGGWRDRETNSAYSSFPFPLRKEERGLCAGAAPCQQPRRTAADPCPQLRLLHLQAEAPEGGNISCREKVKEMHWVLLMLPASLSPSALSCHNRIICFLQQPQCPQAQRSDLLLAFSTPWMMPS